MGTVITHRDANGNIYRKDVTGEPGTGKVCNGAEWAGTVGAPAFTGSPTSVVQPYIVCYFWKRTA